MELQTNTKEKNVRASNQTYKNDPPKSFGSQSKEEDIINMNIMFLPAKDSRGWQFTTSNSSPPPECNLWNETTDLRT